MGDIFACVYPFEDDKHHYAQTAIENAGYRYMPPKVARQETPKIRSSRSARESTEPPQTNNPNDPDTLPYLELRFSDVPRTSSGLVFGTEPACDIILPKIPGISKRHFALTYKHKFPDGLPRLIVRDLGSRFGTSVLYDSQGKGRRRKFDWIINGFDATDDTEHFIVHVLKDLKFRIIVAGCDLASPVYIENVERFRQGAAAAEHLMRGLGLQSGPETEPNTGAHTPVEEPILLRQGQIAEGTFGVVSHHWNVSTGEEYARKKPLDPKYDRKAWEKEIDIMNRISHAHIVRLCFSHKMPHPVLYLEYMPLGNLQDEHDRAPLSPEECLVVLNQSLSALAYLHELPQPVVHRDIKPENILVKHRDPDRNPDYLHIKLSDFGLSKSGSLKTFCGTKTYCAPEIRDTGTPYTKAVDIWSLGVVILDFGYGLPPPGQGFGSGWCRKVVEAANEWDSEGLIDLLQRMLVIDPRARYTAPACLQESRLLLSSADRCATPTPASYAAGHDATSGYTFSEEYGGEEQETFRIFAHEQYLPQYNDQASGYSLTGHTDGGNLSDAPAPDSMERTTATTGKRSKRASKSVSSSAMPSKRRSSTSGQYPKNTVSQDLRCVDDAAEVQGWLPDEDHPNYYPEALTESVAPNRMSGWPGPGSQWSSALVDAGTTAYSHLGTAAVPQVPAADELGLGEHALSHLSTRSVLNDDGTLYIVINRRRVSMRTSDYFLNATEICNAAGLSRSARCLYLNRIKSTGVLSKGHHSSWVPFRDGVFLSEVLNVFDDMKVLLSRAPLGLPEEGENYLRKTPCRKKRKKYALPEGLGTIQFYGYLIVYNRNNGLINLT